MKTGIEKCDFIIVIGTKRLKERYLEDKSREENNLQKEITYALEKAKSKPNAIIPIIKEGNFKETIIEEFKKKLYLF